MNNIKIIILFISMTSIFASCSTKDTDNQTEQIKAKNEITVSKKQFERSEMQIGKAKLITFNSEVKTTGKINIKPEGRALINSLFQGVVKNIYANVGQKVYKGQKLCSLTSIEIISIQQQFAEISAKVNNLKSNYLRQKTLLENNIISKKEFEITKSKYFGTLGTYNGLKQKIIMMQLNPNKISEGKIYSEIQLSSPINGYISVNNCNIGQSVNSGDNLFEILNPSKMNLEFYIFEKDIQKIKIGQEVTFYTPDNENIKFKGNVSIIGKTVNLNNKSITCYAKVNNQDLNNLTENMFMNVEIISSEIKRYALPESSFIYSEDKTYILELNKKDSNNFNFIKKEVKAGKTYNKFTEIIPTDTINFYLTKGAYNLISE